MKVQSTPKLVINFEDVDYSCNKPSMGAVMDFEEAMGEAKAKSEPVTTHLVDLVQACGLPREVIRKLDSAQLEAVVEALTSTKKKP